MKKIAICAICVLFCSCGSYNSSAYNYSEETFEDVCSQNRGCKKLAVYQDEDGNQFYRVIVNP